MARLKPAAKGLIIAAVLAVGGVGLNSYLDSRPEPVAEEVTSEPKVEKEEVVVTRQAEPEPEPVVTKQPDPEPAPVAAEASNAGLDALLKGNK